MFRRKFSGHCRPERFAEVDHTGRIDVRSRQQRAARRARIEPQAVFGGRSGIAAVPAIIEEKHGQARSRQRIGQCGAVRAVSGVAVEDQDDEFRRGGAADEPAVQRQTVCGRKRHRYDAAEPDGVRIGHVRGRKIDEPRCSAQTRTSIATSTMPDESTSLTASRV
jgi:hypothetical protein